MKRTYVRPTMVGERFVANEYVAACGDENKVYKFKCDAPRGWLYYYRESDGKVDGEHEASTTDAFYDGFVDYNVNGKQDPGEGVIVWRGVSNHNGHATTNLNMDAWATAKS